MYSGDSGNKGNCIIAASFLLTPESPQLPPSPDHLAAQLRLFLAGITEVELKPFNDCALNRDVEMLCAKAAQLRPHLPDGRRLLFHGQGRDILHRDAQEQEVA